MQLRADVAIVGGGVLRLAHAYAAARRGHRVVVFERNPRAAGASARNFGMIWPIGQPSGEMHTMAMRTPAQPTGWELGPALASGLTLRFYPAFSICTSLAALRRRVAAETPEYDRWHIHGLISQTSQGELTLGDSHEYGTCVDVFNKEEVDHLILRYISSFLRAPDMSVAQRWHGVYAKHQTKPYLRLSPTDGVRIVTGVGGSGMTLSFGLAEDTISAMSL